MMTGRENWQLLGCLEPLWRLSTVRIGYPYFKTLRFHNCMWIYVSSLKLEKVCVRACSPTCLQLAGVEWLRRPVGGAAVPHSRQIQCSVYVPDQALKLWELLAPGVGSGG